MTTPLSPGEVIPGTRYRILHHVAEGAMGAVYAAEHVDLEKRVALKTLLPRLAQSAEAVERFRKEARAASRIGSPFICDVTDFGALPDGQVFFVMEYLDGPSLADVLASERALPPARTIGILRQVCKALGAAHDKGIVHLDVKPDNVILLASKRRRDGVKVVDFGVAGLAAEAAAEERISGTPEYIAPERALGRGYDHRCDVYALGVMAYEMLTGSVPFSGTELVEILKRHVHEAPEPPARRAPERAIPAALDALVLQLLAKDPAQRPQRMEVVEAMLCEAQIALKLRTEWDHLELPAVDEGWQRKLAERMPSARRERRGLIAGAVAAAVLAAGAAIYFGFVRGPEIKVVRVAVTETEESEAVAALLEQADLAARAGRYLRPDEDSALRYIRDAEQAARDVGRESPGAARLRRAYASALTVTGNELAKAGLRDLAVRKYREALAFLPDDPQLQRAAEQATEAGEATSAAREARPARADEERRRAPAAAGSRAEATTAASDDLADLAAELLQASRQGRFAEARLVARKLAALPGAEAAKARLTDALRRLADGEAQQSRAAEARAIYGLVLELDPEDAVARARLAPAPAATPPAPAAAPPPAPAEPTASSEPTGREAERRSRRGGARTGEASPGAAEAEPLPESQRDEAGAQRAVAEGQRALRAGQLAPAEAAFNQAVRADPQSAPALAGLAEVAFERAQYTEALDFARRAARLAPRVSEVQLVLGDAYFKLLRYADALAAYEKAASLAGRRTEAIDARLARARAKLQP